MVERNYFINATGSWVRPLEKALQQIGFEEVVPEVRSSFWTQYSMNHKGDGPKHTREARFKDSAGRVIFYQFVANDHSFKDAILTVEMGDGITLNPLFGIDMGQVTSSLKGERPNNLSNRRAFIACLEEKIDNYLNSIKEVRE